MFGSERFSFISSLWIDCDICRQGWDTEAEIASAQKLKKLSKPIDMTIHWKALQEHFLI
jgi:hypothetical protein